MSFTAKFAAKAKPATKKSELGKTCVRWNPAAGRTGRYELVVGGVVQASISRLGMSIKSRARNFHAQVALTAAAVKLAAAKEKSAE